MPRTVQQELVDYYLLKTNQKATNRLYTAYLGSMKALVNAGYTEYDIKSVIDYLVEHPPRNGFKPAFIQYTIDETLQKITVERLRKVEQFFEPSIVEEGNNLEKFKAQTKTKQKGMVDF